MIGAIAGDICKVCGDKEGEIKYHMCDYCREALRKKHPGFNRIISRMEERLQNEDENREEILSRLELRYWELMHLERMT